MNFTRSLMLLAASLVTTAVCAADTVTQLRAPTTASPSLKLDTDALTSARPAPDLSAPSQQGLKQQAAPSSKESIELPLGINYSREAKSLLVPLDQKNEWGVGLNLDVNSTRAVELAPSTSPLGLQPKRTPGVTFQKKF